ncbi:ERAP1-like C-terminal domain-containing protein [Vulcanisaeta thermophila]|uniref:ERAP1-like C-terminal domain-containing protein n=1 Tax=Vulcanisaeta thermophila TaxID=867917 RepID=UPI000853AE52|nr:ERAP1-like C-terminal domain-containing protein [Vulcanisaeta thermophila]
MFRQSRFKFIGNEPSTWPIPIIYRSGDKTSVILMEEQTLTLGSGRVEFLNVDGTGYYRVNHGDWEYAMSNAANDYERWSVINDAYAHLLQGTLDINEYLNLIRRVSRSVNYLLTTTVIRQLRTLYSINPAPVRQVLIDYLRT